MAEEGPIVCDAGPLIALSQVGHLDLLRQLYKQILIPQAVLDEVVHSGAGRIGAQEVQSADWLERVHLEKPLDPLLLQALGPGEAEVIGLALHRRVSTVVLDDRRARRIAEQAYRLQVRGTAGILVAARRKNLITAIRPHLRAMTSYGYFLSPRLVERACREVGE